MKILVLSSLARDTGSFIRADQITESLRGRGVTAKLVRPLPKTLPFKLDLLFSLPIYFYKVIFSRCDYILAVKSYPNVGIPIFFKKLISSTKIILDTDDLSFAYTKGLWSSFSKWLQEMFLPLADLHTCHNPKLERYLVKRLKVPPSKVYLLRQGVSPDFFASKLGLKEKQFRKKLRVENNPILIFTGHLDVACDLDTIFKALPGVFQKYPMAKLLIVGDGLRKKELQELSGELNISDKLLWTGLVPNKKISEYLNIADICLVYYRNTKANLYRVSLKIREYLAMGKKVVANDVGDLKLFSEYSYQTESDVDEYGKMITKILKGFDDGRQKKGKLFVKKNYSRSAIGAEFIEFLKNEII
jgi:glycosyltransferase involved in cell wall biosynthesis